MPNKSHDPATSQVENERSQFTSLLAQNPNYFGNLADSTLKAVKQMAGNVKYEELTCVGFNPRLNQLEATFQIKLPFGYGGNLCGAGSKEYVRFFINYGSGWDDVGVAGVNVHDIPDDLDCSKLADKPLTYVVTHPLDPKRDYCKHAVLPEVRAILSWNSVPSSNPNQAPIYGNVLDRHIQIEPRPWFLVDVIDSISVVAGKKLEVPLELQEVQLKPLPLPDPPPLELNDLVALYASAPAKGIAKSVSSTVEPHRFGAAEIKAALKPSLLGQEILSAKIASWKSAGLDWSAAVNALLQTAGNTTYEELDCLGLDNNLEWLAATFSVKKPSGFSGALCQNGSKEYVAFWADWDDTCKWTYLGTVAVNVHDFGNLPKDGLSYAAVLPVDLKYHRQACDKPKIARVRAVLSWSTPPSPINPNEIPHWGNRIDSHVQINPGPPLNVGEVKPLFDRVGGIRPQHINGANGLTVDGASFPIGFSPELGSPFAARVLIQGPGFVGYSYRIQVRNITSGSGWSTLIEPLQIDPPFGPTKFPDANGYFLYEGLSTNSDRILARWDTVSDDLWEIKLDIFGQPGAVTQTLQLKNSGIEDARININPSFGGNCGTFHVGDVLDGAFVARDPYFSSYSLGLLPFAAPAGQLNPTGGNIQTLPAPASPPGPPAPPPPPGGHTWTLGTGGMVPCGYVLLLSVSDRAIVNSAANSSHSATASVGFCLQA
jgi:hypothetical protein